MRTRDMIMVALFTALTAIGAFIRIPIPFVPFTLQYFFCALAGMILGARLGALSQLLYVAIGLIGIPIFTEGCGPGYIFQPTFGYLIGFIAAAYVIGKIVERIKSITIVKVYAIGLAGTLVMYLFGVPYLYVIYNFYMNNAKSVYWVMVYGFLSTIGGDLLKVLIVSIVAVRIIPIIRTTKTLSS